jgi:DNA-binding transcriptional ArsR family regulator
LILAFGGEAAVKDLTARFDISQPAVSQHLAALKEAGLVNGRREGRWVYYRVEPRGMKPLVPTRKASGAMNVDRGTGERIVVRDIVYLGGMCPRCEGMGTVNDIDLTQIFDESKSLNQGVLTIPGYTADGWQVRIFAAAGLDPDKPIKKYTKKERETFLYSEQRKVKFQNINLTYEGLVPRI